MRLVMLLVVMLSIGVGLAQWLNAKPPLSLPSRSALVPDGSGLPAIPTRPQDLKRFEQELNQLVQDAADRQDRVIEGQAR